MAPSRTFTHHGPSRRSPHDAPPRPSPLRHLLRPPARLRQRHRRGGQRLRERHEHRHEHHIGQRDHAGPDHQLRQRRRHRDPNRRCLPRRQRPPGRHHREHLREPRHQRTHHRGRHLTRELEHPGRHLARRGLDRRQRRADALSGRDHRGPPRPADRAVPARQVGQHGRPARVLVGPRRQRADAQGHPLVEPPRRRQVDGHQVQPDRRIRREALPEDRRDPPTR